jgi:hypothetical protein
VGLAQFVQLNPAVGDHTTVDPTGMLLTLMGTLTPASMMVSFPASMVNPPFNPIVKIESAVHPLASCTVTKICPDGKLEIVALAFPL